jgi:Holliday junction resolvase
LSRQRGFQRERAYADLKRADGWWVMRAPASLGAVDLVALKEGETPEMIEVKSTAAGPYHSFGPDARDRLRFEAARAGACALLVWWPPRRQPVVIPAEDWPG